MDTLINKVNKLTAHQPIFYFSNDIERGLGLEKVLKNYHLVCIDDNEIIDNIKKFNPNIFCLSRQIDQKIFRSSVKLLEHEFVQQYLSKFDKKYIQTFKISPRFEKIVEHIGAKLLNTKAWLNRIFENKLNQYEVFSKAGIHFPKTIISKLKEITYEELKKILGDNFIMQFNRGHTGSSTYQISSEEEYRKLVESFPNRRAKFTRFIDSKFTYTINCCIAKNCNYCGGISFQLTGITNLTTQRTSTVGNDFSNQWPFTDATKCNLLSELNKIADVMKNYGYRGLFGVDFIIQDDEIYIIEINARQTASIAMYTKLQLQNNQIPLSLLHIAEFLGVDFMIDPDKYNNENMKTYLASQVFIRVCEEEFEVKGKIRPGIYTLKSDNTARKALDDKNKDIISIDENKDKNLIYKSSGYSIDDIKEYDGMIILARSIGMKLKRGDELARIQLMQAVTDKECNLYPWIIEALNALKNYLN